jgi:hypothetical protein
VSVFLRVPGTATVLVLDDDFMERYSALFPAPALVPAYGGPDVRDVAEASGAAGPGGEATPRCSTQPSEGAGLDTDALVAR